MTSLPPTGLGGRHEFVDRDPLTHLRPSTPPVTGTVAISVRAPAAGSTDPPRAPRPGTVALAVGAVGLVGVVGLGAASASGGLAGPGGRASLLGTVAALAGTYLCLGLLLLVARLPWLERELGQPRLVRLHRTVAPYSLALIGAHVALTMLGRAQATDSAVLATVWSTVTTTAWMLPAAVAFVLMIGIGTLSYRSIRARMSYETWWVAHLYFYLAVALAFGHQVTQGLAFADRTAARWVWIALYAGVAGAIVTGRILIPLLRAAQHRLRVTAIEVESPEQVSVLVTGAALDRLEARGGQFFQWRFLTRDLWWQAHPYSLSRAPDGSSLRITVGGRGDHATALRALRPGTRVVAEGPYGVLTAEARRGDRITAIAAGIGITAIHALLEDTPSAVDVTVVHRVRSRTDAPLRAELAALAAERGWRIHYLEGSREDITLTRALLVDVAPGLPGSDVYVCGPSEFVATVGELARASGVPRERIHHESFSM